MSESNPYVGAYPPLKGRARVWRAIAEYVRRDAPSVDTLVELGAGYCDFSNAFPAKKKIAFDLNPEMRAFAERDVELRIEDATRLPGVPAGSVDLVFASNFLEHLGGEELDTLLPRCREVLAADGRLILIQPNHRLCAEHYFDDPTHQTVFDDANIAVWLGMHGLVPRRIVPGLLPFSMNGRLPKTYVLTAAYLRSPWRPLAAQMYVVAGRG